MPSRLVTALVFAVGMLGAACGDDDPSAGGGDPITVPAVGLASPRYAVPLPIGAELRSTDPASVTEVYLLRNLTLAEAEAFYRTQVDYKPLGDFQWCGKVLTARLWNKPADAGQEAVLEVVLRDEAESEGVTVEIAERVSSPLTCPPTEPESP